MDRPVTWKHPESELMPNSLKECGVELVGYPGNAKNPVTRYCTTFKVYSGEEEIPTYGGKAIVVDQGNPTYAEFAALSLFRQCGWQGFWYDSYRRKKRSGLHEESDGTDSVNDLLNMIASITGSRTGVFDLVLWKDETIFFIELKRRARDRIRDTQIDWLQAALSHGLDLKSFAILQWELEASND